MRNIALRRALALALALVMMLTMAACAPQGGSSGVEIVENTYEGDTLLAPETEFKIVIGSHSSWPYNENQLIWKYFKERVGGNIDIDAFPNAEFTTKINLLMATPDELPDLLHAIALEHVNSHAGSGAYVAVDEHMDMLPNYSAFLDSLEETERKELLMQRTYSDGHIYQPPVYGSQSVMNFSLWMYRKDIFEKHGLTAPTNLDELYDVCKKLKALYPESYPLCFRQGLNKLSAIGPSWKNDFSVYTYYDFQTDEWKYGGLTDTMKEIVIYFRKFMDEGLVPPDFMTITNGSWEELISTDRGFIMPDALVRISFFNVPNQKRNPDYEWVAMEPPAHDANSDHHKITKSNVDPTGYVVPNTGNAERIGNALKVLDWMYTDEAVQLLSWGKEGETYQVDANGKKTFILEGDTTAQILYGASTYGLYQIIEAEAFNQVVAAGSEVDPVWLEWTEDNANPSLYLAFTDEETNTINMHASALRSYIEENLIHFINGTKSMEEWDAYVEGANALGLEEFLGVYESAYNRVRGN